MTHQTTPEPVEGSTQSAPTAIPSPPTVIPAKAGISTPPTGGTK